MSFSASHLEMEVEGEVVWHNHFHLIICFMIDLNDSEMSVFNAFTFILVTFETWQTCHSFT